VSFDPNAWQNTSVENETSEPPDPGKYQALFSDGRAFTSNAGKDFLVLSWRIAVGPLAGHEWDTLYGLDTEGGLKAAKATLLRLSVDVDSITSLEDMDKSVKAATGDWYDVEVKQNGDWRNTFVNGRVPEPAASDVPANTEEFAVAPAGGSAADDTIPF
jgi:hypothetical protein